MKRLLLFSILILPCLARGDVRLPSIFSDHMVLMKSQSVPIWGKADPGEQVTVQVSRSKSQVTAGTDGRWMVRLNLNDSLAGPFLMAVTGKNSLTINDVMVGTVWLASGQSNMELPLQATTGAEREIAGSSNNLLRQFRVEKASSAKPLDDCKGRWVIAGPESSGNFTAAGYYFGKRLQAELHMPVGIVNASWGGTFSELWISMDAINRVEALRSGVERRERILADYPAKKEKFVADYTAWLRANGREDRPCKDPESFAGRQVSEGGWRRAPLPGKISETTGATWIRKEIDVPASALNTGQDFKVLLGYLEGFEEVYWNGKKVSETPYQNYPGTGYSRYFPIPKPLLKAGSNTIAVRIFSPAAPPALSIDPEVFKAGPVSLKGEWLVRTEYELPAATDALATAPKSPARPPGGRTSMIFNGLIYPLIPYALSGVLWYQGESDAGLAYEYRIALRLLIEDWRERWKQEHLPFYICELPGYGPKKSAPGESEWAEVRESQSAVLKLPDTALTVLIDLGESNDIHPRNKKEVGDRLAALVLAPQSSPVYESMKVEDGKIRVRFLHAETGLVARRLPAVYDVSTVMGQTAPLVRNSPESELEGFAICGEDRHWVWADAKIDRDSVVVWSSQVPQPVAVRYGWADNPTVNLFSGARLPAAPFRTDDFPALTGKKHFGLN